MSSESLQKNMFSLSYGICKKKKYFLMLSKWTTFTETDMTKQINPALGLSLQIHISLGHTLTCNMQHAEWEIQIIDLKQSCFVNCCSEHNDCTLHRNIKNSSREKQRLFHISLIVQPINIPIQPFWSPTNVVFWMLVWSTGLLKFLLAKVNKTRESMLVSYHSRTNSSSFTTRLINYYVQ